MQMAGESRKLSSNSGKHWGIHIQAAAAVYKTSAKKAGTLGCKWESQDSWSTTKKRGFLSPLSKTCNAEDWAAQYTKYSQEIKLNSGGSNSETKRHLILLLP